MGLRTKSLGVGGLALMVGLLAVLPQCQALKCYKCDLSIGCHNYNKNATTTNRVEECKEGSQCLVFITQYYVNFARRGCITKEEIDCYRNSGNIFDAADREAPFRVGQDGYLKCFNSKGTNTTKSGCSTELPETNTTSGSGRQEPEAAEESRGLRNLIYSLYLCKKELCNYRPSLSDLPKL